MLETLEMKASLKFNAYSELSFTVSRTYTSMATGETEINPFYDKIEALRLLYLEGFGYFEIQDPEIVSDGVREVKNITAYSLEYTLSQKYLEGFNINTGDINSLEVIYAGDGAIIPITLYNEGNPKLSLLNLILEKVYGWSIGHVDLSLRTMCRMFEVSRVSVYDFIMQDICEKFNCFAIFDTINNTINLYAEALISKHIGDGETKVFIVSPAYVSIDTVSIDGYKTTAYLYDSNTGTLIFDNPPDNGAKIEIVDGSQTQWVTDVYASFENLAQEVNISYSADDIKTVLTVKGSNDLDIREVNMGLPYLVDLSYYYTVDWMGQELYDAYTLYLQKCNKVQTKYSSNSAEMLDLTNRITYEEQRLSLEYSIADHVGVTTVGTYYVKGGTYPNYYYTAVQLPDEYNAEVEHYYTLSDNDITEDKVSKLYAALQTYFVSQDDRDVSAIDELEDSFAFMEVNTLQSLSSNLSKASSLTEKNTIILTFLDEMWNQVGKNPLNLLYYIPYKKIRDTNIEAGWNDQSNENYWRYYPVTLMLSSIENEIEQRNATIKEFQDAYNVLQKENNEIANSVLIDNNFTKSQLARLSAFLREDEYTDDNFIETSSDTIETLMKTKKELLECGRIELSKLCEPKLSFSMDMSNIYAMPEFEPIVHQFQLGNLINVAMRKDYVKRARLLAVDINFDDFSDFTCEFGELTNLKTPSSIHADLLATALSAGKSVASNASYWNKGSDAATSLSILIQQGLLDAATVIKSIDGTQGVSIDQYGIHLQKFDPTTGEIDPKEGWIVNNQFLYSDDNFKTTKSVFGEYVVDGQSKWGLLAEAVMAGYIAGCTIEGGTINIGNGAFVVDEFGNVKMTASNNISGYTTNSETNQLRDNLTSKIELNTNSITAEVTRATTAEGELGSKIQINADSIGAEVTRAKNAENTLSSSIKINADSITAETSRATKAENELSSKIQINTNSITAEVSRATNAEKDLSSKITVNTNSITAEVTRAKNAESSLSSKIEVNANAITSKVNKGDFGTLIEQNYDHVKIAWNKNSKYIQFENAALNVYNSSDTLLMKMDYSGANYYYHGVKVGKIGTTYWSGHESYRGLTFNLEPDAGFMSWCAKDSSSASYYSTKLIYHHGNDIEKKGLHLMSDTYANGYLYLHDNYRVIQYTDGGIGYSGEINLVDNSHNVAFTMDGSTKKIIVRDSSTLAMYNNSSFVINNDVAVDIYSNINMHNYFINNVQITEASDARLKTNIQNAQVDALGLLSKIDMKEFDWIETGEHENIGMIAQQLQMIEPSLVHEDEKTGGLSIKTNKFIPYLIKAVQELYESINGENISTYGLKRFTQWTDDYSIEDKENFVGLTKQYDDDVNNIKKTEIVREPVLVPIND